MNFQTYAILPAAGCGERSALPNPKQFCAVAGRPLITYTLERFERSTWIDGIYVAISDDWRAYMEEIISQSGFKKIHLVKGSTTRHRSIRNCVEALSTDPEQLGTTTPQCTNGEDVIIVHDAVRPFVDEDTLRRMAMAANKHGASGAIRPLVSTIIASDDQGLLDHSLVRSKYRESHTPQAFTYSVIKTAYQKITEDDLDYGTECLHLALEYTGTKAKLVEAPDEVWKVTFRKDFVAADLLAKESTSLVGLVMSNESPISSPLMASLKDKRLKMSLPCMEIANLSPKTTCIVIHKISPSLDTLSHTCNQAVEFLQKNSSYGGVVTCIVSEVVLNNTWLALHSIAHQVVEDLQHIQLYFVLVDKKDHIKESSARFNKACEMAASLVYNRNQQLSGQVFIV